LALLSEVARLVAARERLIYLPVEIRDRAGSLVPDAGHALELALTGPVELMAFGSANPDIAPALKDVHTRAFRGHALVILRSTGRPGTARVSISSPGLASAEIMLRMDEPSEPGSG
jgi:beta-galactosidase